MTAQEASMASTLAPASTTRTSPAARRFGYLVAIVVNGIMIWVAHRLLDWQWPGFLTDDFDAVLWLVSASFVTGMVVNACFLLYDRGRFRAFGDLVTGAFGLAVTLRIWDVFPFDFSDYGNDWSWLFRAVLALGVLGTSIAILVNVAKLIRPTDRHAG
jgi:hypothetical protein